MPGWTDAGLLADRSGEDPWAVLDRIDDAERNGHLHDVSTSQRHLREQQRLAEVQAVSDIQERHYEIGQRIQSMLADGPMTAGDIGRALDMNTDSALRILTMHDGVWWVREDIPPAERRYPRERYAWGLM